MIPATIILRGPKRSMTHPAIKPKSGPISNLLSRPPEIAHHEIVIKWEAVKRHSDDREQGEERSRDDLELSAT